MNTDNDKMRGYFLNVQKQQSTRKSRKINNVNNVNNVIKSFVILNKTIRPIQPQVQIQVQPQIQIQPQVQIQPQIQTNYKINEFKEELKNKSIEKINTSSYNKDEVLKKLEEIISVEVKKYISEELGNFINNAKNMVVDEMKQEMRIKIKNSLRKLCQENTSLNPTSTPDPNEDIILTEEEVQIYEYLKNTILTNNLPINFDNIDESCEKLIEFLLNN